MNRTSCISEIKKYDALKHAIKYLQENDNETITLAELYEVMKNQSDSDDAYLYTPKQMHLKLSEHFGDQIAFITITGKSPIVTLTENMENIIKQAHANARKDDSTMESIIDDVATYIHADIMNICKRKKYIP